MTSNPIVFLDMQTRESSVRRQLAERKAVLEALKKDTEKGGSVWLEEQQDELDAINRQLGDVVADPFFKYVTRALRHPMTQLNGKLPSQRQDKPAYEASDAAKRAGRKDYDPGKLTGGEVMVTAVMGLLALDNMTDTDAIDRLTAAVAAAHGEFNALEALFVRTYPILGGLGFVKDNIVPEPPSNQIEDIKNAKGKEDQDTVSERQWAAVVRRLAADGISPRDPLFRLKVETALASAAGVDDGAPPSSIEIDLPDLEANTAVDILPPNLESAQVGFMSMSLEAINFYRVVDKLAELFQYGMLPIGRGRAGDFLYRYWKTSATRISETERLNMYARMFGFAGGDPTTGHPNREFNDLWMRFLSAVSSYVRQFKVDSLLRSRVPVTVSQEQVRKAGRDLAANLSLHGYGIAYFVATELQQQIKDFLTLLSDQEIRGAYGARDPWQVIEQVSALELGGARNTVAGRAKAQSGAIIIRWLANRAAVLSSSYLVNVLDEDQLRKPYARGLKSAKPTVDPSDLDMINACEQWLAFTGTSDERVEAFTQPAESPLTTSRPIQIPSIARDMLEAAGISANGIA